MAENRAKLKLTAILSADVNGYSRRMGEDEIATVETLKQYHKIIGELVMDYIMNGNTGELIGNRDKIMAPHGCYRCRGEDKWVVIAVASEEEWQSFCNAIGNPEWVKQEIFSDELSRWHNQDELDRLIQEWTRERDHYEVMELLKRRV